LQGDYARAATLYEEQLAIFQEQGDQHGAAWSSHYLGLVAQARNDHERAGELYRQALALRREVGDAAGIAGSLEGLAAVATAQDQPERAARLFGAAAALRETIAFALHPSERDDQARSNATLRARLGAAAFAAALAEGREMPLEQAIDYALAAAGSAGASACPSAEPAAAAPLAQLSRREREVTALVARGLTNRQIAEELVISEWTVDTHVRHILTKLDFRSRTQVAGWVAEQGLLPPEPR
jgi:non-specific serine/threonine protein kinase